MLLYLLTLLLQVTMADLSAYVKRLRSDVDRLRGAPAAVVAGCGETGTSMDISRAVQSGIELTILKNHFIAA